MFNIIKLFFEMIVYERGDSSFIVLMQENQHDDFIKQVAQLTEGSIDDRGDALSVLMRKEARVLDTVDRVVNTTRSSIVESQLFVHLTLTDIAKNSMHTMRDIMFDITHVKRPSDIITIFTKDARKIYVGILLIAIAFLMFFVTSSSS